jgi:hypothetical protein
MARRDKRAAEALARRNDPGKFAMKAFATKCRQCGKQRMLELQERVIVATNTCDCPETMTQECEKCFVKGGHFMNCPVMVKPTQ